jgi:diguanylate cyclase (GGDEF)-like protein
MTMLSLHKTPLALFLLAVLVTFVAYITVGIAKPADTIQWLDVVAEGGTSLMAGVWLLMTLSSRPRGKVTYLLSVGMGLIMLGAWSDCLDEFFKVGKEQVWDHWLEAVFTLGGMLILTAGLYFWRHEQFSLNLHLQKRERLFRDHQAFDRVTQLVDANYLRRLILMEQERHSEVLNCVALLDINSFHLLNREHGVEEGDRALQSVAHMLLLNLSNQDVLCRYAGDRFAIYMPATTPIEAQRKLNHLCAMVAQMQFYTQSHQVQVQITMRAVCSEAGEDLDNLLERLDPLERTSTSSEMPARIVRAPASPACI